MATIEIDSFQEHEVLVLAISRYASRNFVVHKPRAVEAAASEQQLWVPGAAVTETTVTMSLRKTEWPGRQLGQMGAEEEFAARETVRQETQQHKQPGWPRQRLAPEAAQEAERNVHALLVPA